jgi:hypothetical protein
VTKQIDAIYQVYAANLLAGQFYTFNSSGSIPSVAANIMNGLTTQLDEFQKMVNLYAAYRLDSIEVLLSRNGVGLNDHTVFSSLPSVFIAPSLTTYSSPSVATLVKVAQSDQAVEYSLSNVNQLQFKIVLPDSVCSRSLSLNDILSFGKNTWIMTLSSSGYIPAPEVYLNLGSLASPVFKSGASTGYYPVLQLHVKGNFSFACPTVL